jgi:hypothetical protein
MSVVSLGCIFIREGAKILGGGGLSSWSWSGLSLFPRETFLRLHEAVESRESELESRFEDSCIESSDFTPEFTPLSETGEAISAPELASRATIMREGFKMIHALRRKGRHVIRPRKLCGLSQRLEKQRQSETQGQASIIRHGF